MVHAFNKMLDRLDIDRVELMRRLLARGVSAQDAARVARLLVFATWRLALLDRLTAAADPDAAREGIIGPSKQPFLFRRDYVTNSNDSYWNVSSEPGIVSGRAVILNQRAQVLRYRVAAGRVELRECAELDAAVRQAERFLGGNGVVLLSPGAPSFPRYKDYIERGRHFAALAGFDPKAITAIPGLGVA